MPKVPIDVAVVDGKPLATRRVVGSTTAQPRGVAGAADEQVVAQPVDEHDDGATGRWQVEPGAGAVPALPGHAEAPRHARQHVGERRSGPHGRVGGRVARDRHPAAQPWPMAAERSRANASAWVRASSPSAAAEMRSAMSSPVTVPS